ncbi:MAG: hypothetical protein ABR522_15390 [Marinobacter sp.]
MSIGSKGCTVMQSGVILRGERERTHDDVPKTIRDIKTGDVSHPRDELVGVFRMLRKWCPA